MRTIAVCDTEPVLIEGLRSLLEPVDGLCVAAADACLADAVESARGLHPSLLIVDKSFGLKAIADAIQDLRASGSQTAVVVWGASVSWPESLRFLQAGASGVVRKTASLETLLACLRAAASGFSWVEGDAPVRWVGATPRPLSAREAQVMGLVERGMKNKDIAEQLGIAAGTVKIHVKHIFAKTGIRGRYGLAFSALRERGQTAGIHSVKPLMVS